MKKFLVIFEKTTRGYSAYSPDLPGCIATGRTKSQTEINMYNAIQFHIEGMKEQNIKLPKSTAASEYFVFAK